MNVENPSDKQDNLPDQDLSPQEPEEKKSLNVPVEELIPDIKPPLGHMEGVEYRSNMFETSFMESFWRSVMPSIISDDKGKLLFKPDKESKDFSILCERFKDQIIVDLGAGLNNKGYILACLLGAKAYIGVDLFARSSYARPNRFNHERPGNMDEEMLKQDIAESLMSQDSFSMIGKNKDKYNKEKAEKEVSLNDPSLNIDMIPTSSVQEDMLDFLRRLPGDSVSIFMFGIDDMIIKGSKYIDELNRHIERVLSSGGGFLHGGSTIIKGTKLRNLVTKEDENRSKLAPIFDDKLGKLLVKE